MITGAAGQIAYSLIFQVAAGEIFGPNQPIILHLLDIPMCAEGLKGVVLELQDCALSTLQSKFHLFEFSIHPPLFHLKLTI